MGLDCFFERTAKSPKFISFPEELNLCGGMFSGHGGDGSFRGKVYTEFFEENIDVSLFNTMQPEEVAQVAKRLTQVASGHQGQAWDGEWRADAPSEKLGYYGITYREVTDLVTLFQVAADQHLKMVAWY